MVNKSRVISRVIEGLEKCHNRREVMGRGLVTLPPGAEEIGISDINEAYVEFGAGVIRNWFIEKQREMT